MKQFRKRQLQNYSNPFYAAMGIPQRDLAAKVNNRLTEFIHHFNQYALEVHNKFASLGIRDEELEDKVNRMLADLEDMRTWNEPEQQIPNGYLEQMFMRMYEDLVRLIDERFAQYGYAHDNTTNDTTTRHDIGMPDESVQRPQLSARHATSKQKFASGIKRGEVREFYAQYYPQMNQQQIADHFGISVRTLQRYLEDE